MSVPEIKNFDNIPVVHFSCFYDVTVMGGNFPPFLKIMKKLSGFFLYSQYKGT